MAIKQTTAVRNAQLDALNTQIGASARLRIYNGTRPANANTAITSQTMLVELTGNATAFAAAASGGVLTANAISNGTAAATGTASWFRLWQSNGTTAIMDGDVSTSGADVNLNNTSIATGQTVSVTAFTVTDGDA
ncbi:MAG: hypothetical protein IM667_07750 [Phenylobacterium sp.]|uniref:hypothetical protein n=1 Tax=Phenylobacterium sp. TaxID=1871053 RepID=UPI0025E563D6|nr:hypothetical protein [Phenylobacterium sp.]MCA3713013.1 hypothetical protein [Phenylobacterium sp.]MCA3750596.1 hypothetical protein [Phenylobacterium sp.]MCA6236818.1 hypothetical protein [Phenylobacterium sp.]MCA6240514.1 hypothetical protein [Phenylobacterium sp.]